MKGCPSHCKVLIVKAARHILRVCVFFVLFLELTLGSFAPVFASELSEAVVGESVFVIGQLPKPFAGNHSVTRKFGEKINSSQLTVNSLQKEATSSAQPVEATSAASINNEPAPTQSELQTINQLRELEGEAGHNGLDFDMPEGTPVLAVDSGEVVSAGEGDYGITVVIKHSWGKSVYGHLQSISNIQYPISNEERKLQAGDKVTRGQEIGLSGQTGLALGPHLHFGTKNSKGEFVDPSLYIDDGQSTIAKNDGRSAIDDSQVLGEATSSAKVTFEDVSGDDSYLYNYKFNLANGTSAHFGSKYDPRPGFAIADKNFQYKLRFFLREETSSQLSVDGLQTEQNSEATVNGEPSTVDKSASPTVDGNQIDFPIKVAGALATLRYTVLNDRVKEEIVLVGKPDSSQLSVDGLQKEATSVASMNSEQITDNQLRINFEVQTVDLNISKDNDLDTFKSQDGSTYWQIPTPTVVDAAGKSGEITGSLLPVSQLASGSLLYTLTLTSDFLEQASYPVVIDPSVIVANASAPLHLVVSKLGRFGWKLAIEYEIRDDADNILGSDVVITEVRPEETYMDIDVLLRDYFTRRLAVWILGQGNYTFREMSFDRLSSAHFQKADNDDDIDDQYKELRMARKQIIDSFSKENYLKYSLTFNEAVLLQRPLYDEKDEHGNLTGKKLQGASTITIENEKIGAGTEILRPNGAGDLTQLTAFPATTNWSRVDESSVDDTDYVYPGNQSVWYSDRYALQDTALTTETLTSIDITGRFILDDGELYAIGRNVIRRSGSDTVGATRTHNAGVYTTYTDSGVARPGGGSWVVSDLNALQGGLDIDADTDWVNQGSASWFYVTVNFAASNQNPNAPSSLGGHVSGSFTADNTPTLSFTLSDPDGADTVKYQIQIDDSSDLLSPVVDYTSALAAQGSTSFTVGQAVEPTATYTTGSEGQTLSDASYYWQVKAIDNSAAASAYTQANSGAIAFKVDTTAPSAVSNLASSSHTASTWSADTTIDVSWTAATDTGGSGVAGYSYTFDTTSNTTPDTTQDGATTSTTSSAQSDGNSIYFHVRADDNVANWGTASHLGPFYVDTTAPSVPGTPSTTSPTTDSTPTWTFTASTDGGSGLHATTPYSVQWCTDSNFTGCGANTGTATTNSFTHATALADGTWYFRAKATDAVSNASSYSSNGSVTIDTTAPSAPTNVTSTLVLPKQAKISWDAVSGASSYLVYKSITDDSVGFEAIGAPATTSQHYDMSCRAHWFYVTALDSLSNESAASTVIEKSPDCSTSSTSSSTSSSSSSSTSTTTSTTTTASTTPVASFQEVTNEIQEEAVQEKTEGPQLSLPAEPPKTPLFNLPDVGGQLEKILAGAGEIKTFVIAKLTDAVQTVLKQQKKLTQAFFKKTKPILLAFNWTTSKIKGQFIQVKQTLASNLSNFFGWSKVKGAHTQYAYESKWLIVNSKWIEGLKFVTGDFRLSAYMLGSEVSNEIRPHGQQLADYGSHFQQQLQNGTEFVLDKLLDTRHWVEDLGQRLATGGQLFWAEVIDRSPTKISNVAIAYVNPKTVIISWKTSHPTTSKVNYGFDTSYGLEVQDSRHTQNHKLTLTNLDEDRTYYFEVMGQGRDYVYDAYYTFTTRP